MRWFEKPEVLDYIVTAYAGVDEGARQFIWENEDGDVVIGNSRAFTDHVSGRFNLGLRDTAWSEVHEVMRMLGEVVHGYTKRSGRRGQRFRNQQPKSRVIKRRTE